MQQIINYTVISVELYTKFKRFKNFIAEKSNFFIFDVLLILLNLMLLSFIKHIKISTFYYLFALLKNNCHPARCTIKVHRDLCYSFIEKRSRLEYVFGCFFSWQLCNIGVPSSSITPLIHIHFGKCWLKRAHNKC